MHQRQDVPGGGYEYLMNMTMRDSVVAPWTKGQRRWGARNSTNQRRPSSLGKKNNLNGQPLGLHTPSTCDLEPSPRR